MKKKLEIIIEKYLQDSSNNIVGPVIRNQLGTSVSDLVWTYKTKGSTGNGNKAEIPWFAIFNTAITDTATKGYFIVYLFSADMERVYLSLNQGWTFYKENYGIKLGREKIKVASLHWKNEIEFNRNGFTVDGIDLRCNGNLGIGYELGHICGKEYVKNEIPSENILREDLKNMIHIYEQLASKINNNGVNGLNKKILLENDLGIDLTKEELEIEKEIEENITSFEENSKLLLENDPEHLLREEQNTYNFNGEKVDFEKKHKMNKKIGFAGELMVVKYEKEILKASNREDLAVKVEHISKTKGDGFGYDVLSYDSFGNEIYIEVKTTKGNKEKEFYMSDVEIAFSEKTPEKYYLYRVY